MRGEDSASASLPTVSLGSPPHARGRLLAIGLLLHVLRITPACAGKTDIGALDARTDADHPRMRGEDEMPDEWYDRA